MRELPHTRTHAVPRADDEIGYIIPLAEWDEEAPWLQNATETLVRRSQFRGA